MAEQKHAALPAGQVRNQIIEVGLLVVLIEQVHGLLLKELPLDQVLDDESVALDQSQYLLDAFNRQAGVGLDQANSKRQVLLLMVEEEVLRVEGSRRRHRELQKSILLN